MFEMAAHNARARQAFDPRWRSVIPSDAAADRHEQDAHHETARVEIAELRALEDSCSARKRADGADDAGAVGA